MNRRKCTQSTPSLLLSFQLDTFAAKYHQKKTYLAITWSGNAGGHQINRCSGF